MDEGLGLRCEDAAPWRQADSGKVGGLARVRRLGGESFTHPRVALLEGGMSLGWLGGVSSNGTK